MHCSEVKERIEAYLEGDLEPAQSRALAKHLDACADCAADLELARRVAASLRALPRLSCPESVSAALAARIAAVSELEAAQPRFGRPRSQPSVRRIWRQLAMAAAVLALAGAALFVLRFDRSASGPSVEPAYDAAQIAQAEQEARLAFAYLGLVTQRARTTLRDEVILDKILAPPRRALGALGREGEPR